MRLYVDTSALVKLWIDEDGAEAVRIAFEDAVEVASSLIALAEQRATLGRLLREGRVSRQQLPIVEAQSASHIEVMTFISPDEQLVRDAGELAFRYGLKTLDAIHLASAVVLRLVEPDHEWVFLTFDLRLARAASAEGFRVWPSAPTPPLIPGLRPS